MPKNIEEKPKKEGIIEEKDKKKTPKENNKKEKERQKKLQEKLDIIKEDLNNQLTNQGKFGKQFEDMVEDYLFFVKLKEDLQLDIKINGLRCLRMTGNGFPAEKPNESVQNLIKVNAQMLKILQDLDLKAPDEEGEGDDLL
jgi:hypothetical protein